MKNIDPSNESTRDFVLLQVHVVSTYTCSTKRLSNNVITARCPHSGTNCYMRL